MKKRLRNYGIPLLLILIVGLFALLNHTDDALSGSEWLTQNQIIEQFNRFYWDDDINVIFVDGSRDNAFTENGTVLFPYDTVAEAITAAAAKTDSDQTIFVFPGTYAETVTIAGNDTLVSYNATITSVTGNHITLSADDITTTGTITISGGAVTATTANLTAASNQIVFDSDGTYTGTLTMTPASSSKTVTIQNVTGTLYVSSGTDVALADGGTGIDSSGVTNGQLLIGNTAGNVLALATVTGTADQVTVTNGASSITLSTPQSINTTSDVEFNRVDATDFYWEDEFVVIDAPQWTTDVTTGSVAIQAAAGGTERLTTGASITNEESLDWNDITTFINTQRPVVEVRFQLEQTTVIEVHIGLTESEAVGDDDYIRFIYDASVDGNWRLTANTAGTPTADVGAAADTSMHTFRFEWTSDTALEWFIDGASQGVVETNVPTALLQPCIKVLTEENGAHYIDVEYFKIWQDRT